MRQTLIPRTAVLYTSTYYASAPNPDTLFFQLLLIFVAHVLSILWWKQFSYTVFHTFGQPFALSCTHHTIHFSTYCAIQQFSGISGPASRVNFSLQIQYCSFVILAELSPDATGFPTMPTEREIVFICFNNIWAFFPCFTFIFFRAHLILQSPCVAVLVLATSLCVSNLRVITVFLPVQVQYSHLSECAGINQFFFKISKWSIPFMRVCHRQCNS